MDRWERDAQRQQLDMALQDEEDWWERLLELEEGIGSFVIPIPREKEEEPEETEEE